MNIRLRLNESMDTLFQLAKQYDYATFLGKTDSLSMNILYRGMDKDDSLTNNIFMTDYIGHARQYGEYVDGIIYDTKDVLFFTDNIFNQLRTSLKDITKKEIHNLYSYYFKNSYFSFNDKVSINFVYDFIHSDKSYSMVIPYPRKHDLLIPIMLYYANTINKNIIGFLGSDYSEYGGQNEFVVNDISRYTKLSDIWESVNK